MYGEFFIKKDCIIYSCMVYSNSGQEKHDSVVLKQAKSLKKGFKKSLHKNAEDDIL